MPTKPPLPMLACTLELDDLLQRKRDTLKLLKFPYVASPKYDGLRVMAFQGTALTRTLKPIPNLYIQRKSVEWAHGLDGEIVVGDPLAEDVYHRTESGVMSVSGEPDFTVWWFDRFDCGLLPVAQRMGRLSETALALEGRYIRMELLECIEDLLLYEALCYTHGFEGCCLRQLHARYKHGRSTLREGALLRVIREATDEAQIVGFKERQRNLNPQTRDERGYAKRSSSKDGKVGAGDLGALVVWNKTFGEFDIGTGFDDAMRVRIWNNKNQYLGKTVTFKYKPYGVKDKPRQPRFKGLRSNPDM